MIRAAETRSILEKIHARAHYIFEFTTAVIERYQRRETSIEKAIIEMHPAEMSTR